MLRGLDLFSGIGGISLALKPWVKTIAYCEIEPYCQAVLLERMQSNDLDIAPVWDDVTTLNREILDTEIDIIFGGFPCQDVSVAGKQAGIKEETRSGLFFHIMRLVREYRPQFIFLENVAAICSNGLDTVLREIAEAGFDAKWCCVSAAEAGAPHKRDRWWLLAYSAGFGMEGLRSDGKQKSDLNEQKALSLCSGQRWPAKPNEPQQDWEPNRCTQSRLGGNFDGVSYRVDRVKALGNSVVPQAARKAFEMLMFEQNAIADDLNC